MSRSEFIKNSGIVLMFFFGGSLILKSLPSRGLFSISLRQCRTIHARNINNSTKSFLNMMDKDGQTMVVALSSSAVLVSNSSANPILRLPNSTYYRVVASNTGELSTTNIGK